jgi:hypothetical protein
MTLSMNGGHGASAPLPTLRTGLKPEYADEPCAPIWKTRRSNFHSPNDGVYSFHRRRNLDRNRAVAFGIARLVYSSICDLYSWLPKIPSLENTDAKSILRRNLFGNVHPINSIYVWISCLSTQRVGWVERSETPSLSRTGADAANRAARMWMSAPHHCEER